MKYLFWLIVGLFIWWAWKRANASQSSHSGHRPKETGDKKPQNMVSCTHCGVHLPKDDAVLGTRGHYCGTAHRSASGDHNPG